MHTQIQDPIPRRKDKVVSCEPFFNIEHVEAYHGTNDGDGICKHVLKWGLYVSQYKIM